jgi:hypothetical protein
VGYEIGLFSEAVVNAVLVLILVSIVVSTLVGEREKSRVERPPATQRSLGEHILVVVVDIDGAALGLRLATAIAGRAAGFVDVLALQDPGQDQGRRQADLDRLRGVCSRLGVDADPAARVTEEDARTTVLAASDFEASLVLVVEGTHDGGAEPDWAGAVALATSAPVAIVRGVVDSPLAKGRVVAEEFEGGPAERIVAEMLSAMPRRSSNGKRAQAAAELVPGDLAVVRVADWTTLATAQPAPGAGLVLVPDDLVPAAVTVPSAA